VRRAQQAKPEQPERDRAAGPWLLVQIATITALVLWVVDGALFITRLPPEQQGPTGLFSAGMTLIFCTVAYGVWQRARWALWVGGVTAAVSAPIMALATAAPALGNVSVGGGVLEQTALSAAMGWAQVATYVAFLAGLVLLRRARASGRR